MTAEAMKLEVIEPHWLIALGDTQQVEVMRSPLVTDDDESMQPIHRHIADHGLVLAHRETIPNPDFMFGEFELSVYAA